MRAWLLVPLLFLGVSACVKAGEAPDGTAFVHSVLAVESAETMRIRFCGVPLQVKLANLQFKGAESEKQGLKYLKETLKPGTAVKIELEPDLNLDSPAPPLAQVFAGEKHVNLDVVKRGLAISDGRSRKYSAALQAAQADAMSRKIGVWAASETAVATAPLRPEHKPAVPAVTPLPVTPPAAPPPSVASAAKGDWPSLEIAPAGYSGPVVADLSSKEYHYPASRYARNIRVGAKIEYKNPEEAERAGKSPSPFSLPDRAKALAARQTADGMRGGGAAGAVENARKALSEALGYMQEARKLSRANGAAANENWRKAAKLLTEHLDRVIPIADADPNNKELQKLTEDMSMNLYSCKKYQSL